MPLHTIEAIEPVQQRKTVDIMAYNRSRHAQAFKVLDHGRVELVDVMPRQVRDDRDGDPTCDYVIAEAARTSFGRELDEKTAEDDHNLIDFLMRHRHSSPFEMASVKIRIRVPFFVLNQFKRHRTIDFMSMNEKSGRYTVIEDLFYEPDEWRTGRGANKQASGATKLEGAIHERVAHGTRYVTDTAVAHRDEMRGLGVSKELARVCMPQNQYTTLILRADIHNLLHLLSLRDKPNAQPETQAFARAMDKLIRPFFPVTFAAYDNHVANAVTFSQDELAFALGETVALSDSLIEIGIAELRDSRAEELVKKLQKAGKTLGVEFDGFDKEFFKNSLATLRKKHGIEP